MQEKSCWYRQGCTEFKPNCTKICHRFLEMYHLISTCGMPNAEKYIVPIEPTKVDLNAYRQLKTIKDEVVQFVNQGKNLHINSKLSGSGKTIWALKILYKYFDEIWCGNGFRTRGYFIYTPDFIVSCKNMDYLKSSDYKEKQKLLKECDLVVWDDVINPYMNNFDLMNISSLINYRCLNGKSNIFTSSLSQTQTKNIVDAKLFSVLWEDSISVILESKCIKHESSNTSGN